MSSAAAILQEAMELYRNEPFNDLGNGTHDLDEDVVTGLNNLPQWQDLKVIIQDYGDEDDDNIKQVTIEVTWTLSGESVSRSITTLVTRGGINP